MKETITAALAIPFVIISTWLGISAVNHHFDTLERQATQQEQVDRWDRSIRFESCVRKAVEAKVEDPIAACR